MAQREVIKKYIFFIAIIFCVFLISIIWINGFLGYQTMQPGYYRNTVPANDAFYLTRTAEYENYALGTPTPTGAHEGKGGGDHQGDHGDLIPTPTIDWDAREDDV